MGYVLAANSKRHEDALAKVSAVMDSSIEERCAAAKQRASDEYAAFAGVVTINQAEATFIDLNVQAYSALADAFVEWTPLGIGQIPIYKLRQEYYVRVNMGHLGGSPPMVKYQTTQSGVQVVPFQYFSEETLVPNLVNVSFDINKFQEKEKALLRIAQDMKIAQQQYVINTMLNAPMTQNITTSIANWYALGSPFSGRTPYVLDPFVQAGSIATTNTINAVAEGGLTRNVFRAIRSQFILARHNPKALFIPIVGNPWEAYWNQASIVAYTGTGVSPNSTSQTTDPGRAIPTSKWEEAANMGFSENGQYMNWFGMNIWVQPTNILAQGYFLVASDAPAVMGWNQLDASISDEDPLTGSQRGMNKRFDARSIALAQADPQLLTFSVGKLQ